MMKNKKLWFRNKYYGWGWVPCTWQGWLITFAFIALLVINAVVLIPNDIPRTEPTTNALVWFFIREIILVGALIYVCYKTGEKPEWRWGGKSITNYKLGITNGQPKEEMVDVLDAEGNKTGKIVPKKEVHRLGLWHRGAHVYIINSKNEILLQRRSSDKLTFPNMWYMSAGGHIDAGETPLIAARRETNEELGLNLLDSDLIHIGTISKQDVLLDGSYKDNEYNDIYLIQKDIDISKLRKQKSEVADIRWFPIAEFKNRIQLGDKDFINYAGLPVLFSYLENHGND